jgi:hypothetical protein
MVSSDIATQRLINQRITGEKCGTPEAVVKWMGAIQAQDYGQALWAIGSRTESATITDVESAIAEGRIIRTWPMRGTIHFVPAEDAKWMLNLCASRVLAGRERRMQQLGLTDDDMARCEALFVDALSGGKRLTRPDMLRLVTDVGISTEGQRGYHILGHIAHAGVICLGPMEGKQQTFALLDEWVPQSRDLSREEALAELVWRYFASHGPATEADFARWTGLTLADTRLGLEMVNFRLMSAEIEGTTYWMTDGGTAPTVEKPVSLLPGFDEYVIGYQDRSAVLSDEHAGKIVPGNNGLFLPMIVVEGQVVGTWKRKLKRRTMDISLHPFEPLGELEAEVAAAARAYSDFMGLPITAIETVDDPVT